MLSSPRGLSNSVAEMCMVSRGGLLMACSVPPKGEQGEREKKGKKSSQTEGNDRESILFGKVLL